MKQLHKAPGSRLRVRGFALRPVLLALAVLLLAAPTTRGQGPNALPTPIPQPFSPNGVLRPIIPYQPAVPIPTMRPLSVIPLPTPAPNIRIAPLHTPSSVVASQAQNLIKTVPMHRRWPVLQPLDTAKPAAQGGAASPAAVAGVRSTGAVASQYSSRNVPEHRRPLGW